MVVKERDSQRQYQRCERCQCTFLLPEQRLPASLEKAEYDQHENEPGDSGYRRFLSRLADPLLARLPAAARGLDFGCGPGPALAAMLREAGHPMALYDPYFAPDTAPLAQQWDFITCTEVVEHLYQPASVFRQLDQLLAPGGWLGIMTCLQTDDARFANWHYRRDPTHVVFYREQTLRYLAGQLGWECEFPARNVALFQKPALALAGTLNTV
ncbi:MAG: class I SAM-dependent methyltransferase [Halomonadaceae bacterium]|nr:MAG: class I SAM-dependent methyltransferase [Halomonadaceae bacterium]